MTVIKTLLVLFVLLLGYSIIKKAYYLYIFYRIIEVNTKNDFFCSVG